jgi:NAD(P)-dependent dehydrogenase (short-subunit alcohol dehydrogenase family)
VAAITGGDSGIGRAVAIAFAKAGADIAIIYLNGHRSAEEARQAILQENVRCSLVAGNVASEGFCCNAVKRIIAALGRLDILVNNMAEQHPRADQLETAHDRSDWTLRTNLLGMFRLTSAAMPHLRAGGAIINTTAVTAWRDNACLIDDAATAGTIVSFTRSVARTLIDRRIRVNAVTPGSVATSPIRTGVHSSRREQTPALDEIASSYISLAAQGDSLMTGQVLHARAAETAA